MIVYAYSRMYICRLCAPAFDWEMVSKSGLGGASLGAQGKCGINA